MSIEKENHQTPVQLLHEIITKFKKVENYQADIRMKFDIPFVRIDELSGKVYFKQPDKFRVKTEGIAFLPKQNPAYAMEAISDSNKYTAVESGTELIGKIKTRIINVLPRDHPELILAKFWIDPVLKLILKSELTTRTNGTIKIEYQYGPMSVYTLPDVMTFTVETGKFKMPKMMTIDINTRKKETKSTGSKDTGTIQLRFSNYRLNQKFDEKVFGE
jgi:outer membrane lipoprotein-sorting protein